MSTFLILAFLFSVGAMAGWVLEVFYRRFFSSMNPKRKWINPGFCSGPWLPLYGFGLSALYLLSGLEPYMPFSSYWANNIALFVVMAVAMTAIEYIAGLFCLKIYNIRLWDYRHNWGNIQGLICPLFSVYWAILCALYFFAIHPHIIEALKWLSKNLAFSFFIGLFYGVFLIDVVNSTRIITKVRRFARDSGIIVHYEQLKHDARGLEKEVHKKIHFFFPFISRKMSFTEMMKLALDPNFLAENK